MVRPAARETMAQAALDASQWKPADEDRWRAVWDTEIATLPSHRESRFWLVAGLLLPIWDRLPDESMRVRRLVTDRGEHLIGRALGPAEVTGFRAALGLAGGPGLTADEAFDEIMVRGASFPLANGWKLARRRLMGGRPHRDRGTRRRRHCPARAHGLHGRDRLLAHRRGQAQVPPLGGPPRGGRARRGAGGLCLHRDDRHPAGRARLVAARPCRRILRRPSPVRRRSERPHRLRGGAAPRPLRRCRAVIPPTCICMTATATGSSASSRGPQHASAGQAACAAPPRQTERQRSRLPPRGPPCAVTPRRRRRGAASDEIALLPLRSRPVR